ncbi:hypothetical protein ACQZV8_14920 [Magnetococcales bacterium HHB-1]
MDKEDLRAFLEAADEYDKENTETPEKARQALVRSGIYTEDGELAEPYRS